MEEERDQEMNVLEEAFNEGRVLVGTVKKIMPYGAFVDVDGVEGLLHISDISWKKIGKVEDVLKQDQEVDVKINLLTVKNREFLSPIKNVSRIRGKHRSIIIRLMSAECPCCKGIGIWRYCGIGRRTDRTSPY